MRLGVVQEQSQTLPVTVRPVRLDLLQLAAAFPDPSYRHRSIQFERTGRARQRVQNALDVGSPHPEIEVEIMLTITNGDLGWLFGCVGCMAGKRGTDNTTNQDEKDAEFELHNLTLLGKLLGKSLVRLPPLAGRPPPPSAAIPDKTVPQCRGVATLCDHESLRPRRSFLKGHLEEN